MFVLGNKQQFNARTGQEKTNVVGNTQSKFNARAHQNREKTWWPNGVNKPCKYELSWRAQSGVYIIYSPVAKVNKALSHIYHFYWTYSD